MKLKLPTVLLILLLILPLFLNCNLTAKAATGKTSPDLYFGVDVGFAGVAATEQLIDTVSSYTNFFIIGCTNNYNLTTLTTISDYVYSKGLYFIVYSDNPRYPSRQWLQDAKSNYGNSFLGIYYFDEPGGKQLDQQDYPTIPAVEVNVTSESYSDIANMYVNTLNYWIRSGPYAITNSFAYPTEYQLFTSDYGLYWYDYEAGYNTVFAEFTMNYSRSLNIALCRGAATAQDKNWGVMITDTYTQPPYMENGTELYNDMVLAYENDAQYIIVFDTSTNFTQNVLTQNVSPQGQGGQLAAMQQFWQYVQANPRTITPASERTAYVLPTAYGYGFRGPQDKIWGLWSNDSLTLDISMSVATLLKMDGNSLDIVYPLSTLKSAGYQTIVYWNNTELIPAQSSQQGTSLPFYVTTVFLYAIAASITVAFAVALTVFKFRKKRRNLQSKVTFSQMKS